MVEEIHMKARMMGEVFALRDFDIFYKYHDDEWPIVLVMNHIILVATTMVLTTALVVGALGVVSIQKAYSISDPTLQFSPGTSSDKSCPYPRQYGSKLNELEEAGQ